jgi:hypothetical protein
MPLPVCTACGVQCALVCCHLAGLAHVKKYGCMMPTSDESGTEYYELGILDKVENLYPDYIADVEGTDLSRPGISGEKWFCETFLDSFCKNFHRYSLPKVRIWYSCLLWSFCLMWYSSPSLAPSGFRSFVLSFFLSRSLARLVLLFCTHLVLVFAAVLVFANTSVYVALLFLYLKVRIWVIKSVGKCTVCSDIDSLKKKDKAAAKVWEHFLALFVFYCCVVACCCCCCAALLCCYFASAVLMLCCN